MIKLFIEMTLNDFFIALIKGKETLDYKHYQNFIKKSDILVDSIEKLITKNAIDINNIDAIYVTKGPGSYMGIRAGLMFARTFCFLKNIPLFTTSTLELLSYQGLNFVTIDAKSNHVFSLTRKNNDEKKFSILIKDAPFTKFHYLDFVDNPSKYLNHFKKENSLFQIKPFYMKEPDWKI